MIRKNKYRPSTNTAKITLNNVRSQLCSTIDRRIQHEKKMFLFVIAQNDVSHVLMSFSITLINFLCAKRAVRAFLCWITRLLSDVRVAKRVQSKGHNEPPE
jgi:hypothetical protein